MKHIPRKRFGQHFLHNNGIIQKLIDTIQPTAHDHMVEIGPGQGALTHPLAPLVERLILIEVDRDLAAKLRDQFPQCTLLEQDALTCDIVAIARSDKPLRIVGNLPYNISTPILFHLFNMIDVIQDMHFMLQKEVVDRLAAPIGTKTYGRLSVMAQYYCEVEKCFTVSPGAFYPPPKVDSAVIRLTPHMPPLTAKDPQLLAHVVATAFGQRRKTLRNSLKSLISATTLEKLKINPQIRPEQLSMLNYVKIANCVGKT